MDDNESKVAGFIHTFIQNADVDTFRPGSDAVLYMSQIEFEFRPTQINLDRLN